MQQINEKSHYARIISSLNKEYKKAKIGKSINPIDIYLLAITYDLLQEVHLILSDEEIKQLLKIYSNLLYNSKIICNDNCQEIYQINKKNNFIQAEKTDCNNIPIQPIITKIYYWQEPLGVISDDILELIESGTYLETKSLDSISVFEEGKDINYTDIGLICFALNNISLNDNYHIYDDDNNADITTGFESFYNEDLKTRIFISYNIYSYGIMNFKIKKT
jgi:hypothetical protein